ncbi:MAG TPA: lipopolysaccharide heptosyltransferase II [Pyrinomonadaceae bacterium]|nr:lipopolysaccharide heptosyltransferase II [Pyrinomonadaceae bacterium]
MRQLRAEEIERVVVRGANWVGDAVMTVPALRELRRVLPRARVTLATRAWAQDIFDEADFIDDLLVVEGARGVRPFFRQVRDWRARRFDLALLLPNSMESALVAFAARVPVRVGYATESRGEFLTHALETPAWRGARHEVFYYLNIVAGLERALTGASAIEAREPEFALDVSQARQAQARALLDGRGADTARTLVAVCPGSTNSRAKRWHADRFAALADRLIEEAGATVLLIGAGDELGVTKEVLAKMRHRPVVLTGETTLAETTAILSVCGLLVTNDTGPAHLASALGRPTLVIFGPTNPLTTRPFAPGAEIVRRPPDCAPCMLRDCPIDHRCMTAIEVGEVFARAVALLDRRVAPPGAAPRDGRRVGWEAGAAR